LAVALLFSLLGLALALPPDPGMLDQAGPPRQPATLGSLAVILRKGVSFLTGPFKFILKVVATRAALLFSAGTVASWLLWKHFERERENERREEEEEEERRMEEEEEEERWMKEEEEAAEKEAGEEREQENEQKRRKEQEGEEEERREKERDENRQKKKKNDVRLYTLNHQLQTLNPDTATLNPMHPSLSGFRTHWPRKNKRCHSGRESVTFKHNPELQSLNSPKQP
jgi:hypothetical protein